MSINQLCKHAWGSPSIIDACTGRPPPLSKHASQRATSYLEERVLAQLHILVDRRPLLPLPLGEERVAGVEARLGELCFVCRVLLGGGEGMDESSCGIVPLLPC